jgi:hypothetical protein
MVVLVIMTIIASYALRPLQASQARPIDVSEPSATEVF